MCGIQALMLDMFGVHCEQFTFLRKQLTLRVQLYDVPNNSLDKAMTLIKRVSMTLIL